MKPKCRLIGEDGNAYSILGRVSRALREAGQGDKVAQFMAEATAGDYDHLLATCMDYVDEPDEDSYEDSDNDR